MNFRLLTPLALLLVLAACGDDGNGGPSPSDHPAGLLVIGSFDVEDSTAETSNLMFALQQAGYPLDTTSAMDSTSIATLLSGKDILFFPEDSPTFDAGTQAILADFVEGGGTIVLVGGYGHLTWINTAFGWSITDASAWNDGSPMPKAAGASSTPYADGAATIPANDGGQSIDVVSLPDGGLQIYEGPDGAADASVAVIPSGSGRVVYFGWDWYDGAPYGVQDGGWRTLLRLSAGF